ncbi:hypothetical protein SIL77_09640 [Exiguobacterium profundum]|uniref:hypothetical protein n=1 Tax=Exiguobacterium profundum TaxID=307643 RepID=UPI0029C143E3|nr:hypothetical protein [Exiguobacterium profundum]MDX5981522.1 hypothetical protein [Exiguobacterium profundum]
MKKIFSCLLFSIVLSVGFLFNTTLVNAEDGDTTSVSPIKMDPNSEIGTFAVTNPGDTVRYPNSSIVVRSGDVLLSDKSWDATKFAGHAAIVGPNSSVHEVLPGVAGRTVSLSQHRSNQSGGTVRVYRHSSSSAASSASIWAMNNVNKVTSYWLRTDLTTVSSNYCSKFVWQAYHKTGSSIGFVTNPSYEFGRLTGFVYPSNLKTGMTYIGSYK